MASFWLLFINFNGYNYKIFFSKIYFGFMSFFDWCILFFHNLKIQNNNMFVYEYRTVLRVRVTNCIWCLEWSLFHSESAFDCASKEYFASNVTLSLDGFHVMVCSGALPHHLQPCLGSVISTQHCNRVHHGKVERGRSLPITREVSCIGAVEGYSVVSCMFHDFLANKIPYGFKSTDDTPSIQIDSRC